MVSVVTRADCATLARVHDLATERVDYTAPHLLETDVPTAPLPLFEAWLADALRARDEGRLAEPNAMVVATSVADRPHARTVLLKSVSADGFTFFTNYASHKGTEIAANAAVALHFGWYALQRQVRVEGTAAPVSRAESEDYFRTRPRGSQLGAWASAQSSPVASAAELAEQRRAIGRGHVPSLAVAFRTARGAGWGCRPRHVAVEVSAESEQSPGGAPVSMTLRIEIFPARLGPTVDFYTRVLGFAVLRREGSDVDGYVALRRGKVQVGAATRAEHAPDLDHRRPPTGVELVLEVDDVEEELERVRVVGWPVEEELTLRPWGLRDFRLLDPNGYYLRVTGRDPA
jgi:pyridoxamine 5'-phosphate oxidase